MADSISCVLPAYGLSKGEIFNTLGRLPGEVEVIVVVYNEESVDPISTSDLKEVDRCLRILTIPFQVGKSEAVRRGIDLIFQECKTCSIFTQIDGDLKQPPEELEGMINNLRQGRSSMVIGNRYAFSIVKNQTHRIAAVKMVSSIVRCVTGFQLVDTLCGMRAYSRELAEYFLRLRSFGYGLEIEQLLIASKLGLQVENYPVHSKLQDDGTNAEKIEDNLSALICYCDDLKCTTIVRSALNNALAMVKRRISYEIDLREFGAEGIVHCKYMGNSSYNRNAYASGSCRDGYSFNP